MTTTTNVSVFVALATCTMLAACTLHGVDDGNLSPDAPDAGDAGTSIKVPSTPAKDSGTSSGDSGSGDGGTAMTPTTLPAAPPRQSDLVLWLDPQVGVDVEPGTMTVSTWQDLSGKSTVTPGAALALDVTGLGSRQGVDSHSGVTVTLAKSLGQRPFSMFMVERMIVPSTAGWLFGTNDSDAYGHPIHLGLLLANEGLSAELAWQVPPSSGVAADLPLQMVTTHIVSLHRHGMGVDVQIDGDVSYASTSPVLYDAAGVSGAGEQIFFGGMTNGFITLGDILVYDADLSALDQAEVRGYLQTMYGL